MARVARFLTAAAAGGDAFAGGWAVFWNELLDGAPPGRHRSVATALTRLGDTVTSRTAVARSVRPPAQRRPRSETNGAMIRVGAGLIRSARVVLTADYYPGYHPR